MDLLRPRTNVLMPSPTERGTWIQALPRMAPEARLQRDLANADGLRAAMELYLRATMPAETVLNPLLAMTPYGALDLSWRNLPGWMMIAPPGTLD